MKLHVFGKPGCGKCAVLKKRLADLLERLDRRDIAWEYHDLGTVEGLTAFCHANINPNRIPALLAGNDAGDYLPADGLPEDAARTYPWLGIHTDYFGEHRGIITPEMIRNLIEQADRGLKCTYP